LAASQRNSDDFDRFTAQAIARVPPPRSARHGPNAHAMIRSAAELDGPESPWNRAAASADQGDPFSCRTEWQLSLQEAYFPRRPLHLRQDATSLVALAERRHPELGPVLEPLDCLFLFGSALLGPDAGRLLEDLLAERDAEGGEPVQLLLGGLVPGGPHRDFVLRRLARRGEIFRVKTVTVCSGSLAGGLDGYLGRRSALQRKRLRQAARRARARGVLFERSSPRSDAEADATFARILAVEETSWKGLARRGIGDRRSRLFYGAMLRRLARAGAGRVMFARADERDVGFIFGGLAGDRYRGQQFSYAEDFADCSLGNLLQQEQIAWLAEDGIRIYDMGPLMAYKHHWTELRTTMEALWLRPWPARVGRPGAG